LSSDDLENPESLVELQSCHRRRLGLADLRCVFVDDSSGDEVVLARSPTDELEIELARVVRIAHRGRIERYWRFVNFGIRQQERDLYVSIRGENAPVWDAISEPFGAGLRILVPENVRLEFVSDVDRTVCRDFPTILVLRSANGVAFGSRRAVLGHSLSRGPGQTKLSSGGRSKDWR
jgi:hypothetical protein